MLPTHIVVDAQYGRHKWQADVVKSLCDARKEHEIRSQICAAAPPAVALPSHSVLHGCTSTGARWNHRNISDLPNKKYFMLVAAGVWLHSVLLAAANRYARFAAFKSRV